MSECIKVSANKVPLDPRKRLNYEFGMVLGVNDFRQEQEHFEWKHQLSNRLLHGSGTVCGLKISAQSVPSGDDVEIRILPGYALTPKGHWISVESEQCGKINQWLQSHKNDLNLSPGPQHLFVTLCYDECYTELVPIAGQACASDEDSSKPSRILESFKIEFSLQAPDQLMEEAARTFGELMQRVEFIPHSSSPPELDDSELLIGLIRNIGIVTSPPVSPLPEGATIRLLEDTACTTLRQVLNIWVTEVCPRLTLPSVEDCLLLADIGFNVDASGNLIVNLDAQGRLMPGTVTIDESERPVLISDRVKQELFCLIGRRITV
ncbi:hypothetical protein [Nitrosomonas ureae]|uniref:Uncharacterized protein n=1 Tax=Nitrosomonas ureae TaxID=44577 RepID=A0A1H9D0U2_9PROT|nr:hypothetical protein [Nitrosomonas ureae]SEQ07054.1 hypothetical protein SAMN05421510_101831 [Nitrosomonas ureae]